MVRENSVRHRPFSLVVGRLMIIAMKVPKKKFRTVAKKAQIRVQPRTLQNCLLRAPVEANSCLNTSRPTQSKYRS